MGLLLRVTALDPPEAPRASLPPCLPRQFPSPVCPSWGRLPIRTVLPLPWLSSKSFDPLSYQSPPLL